MKRLPLLMMLLLPLLGRAQFTCTTNADNSLTITGYGGSNGVVLIPSTIAGLSVTTLGDWAFYAASITNVLIPDSVTAIGDGAFFDCESLTNVTIGNTVSNIGDWAFGFCPSLTSVCCRGSPPAFGGSNVFYGDLATIYYLSEATGWGPTFDGQPAVLWNPDVPFSYTTNSDDITLTITSCTSSGNALFIPNNIDFLPVTTIGYEAFFFCGSLTNIIIGYSVSNLEVLAFGDCPSLTAITVDTNNPFFSSLDGVLFDHNQMLLLEFPSGKTGSYSIPVGVTDIGEYSFASSSELTGVTTPASVTNIEDNAFYGSNLTSLTMLNGITNIGDDSFAYCTNLTNITFPGSVVNIGESAFAVCNGLYSITFSNSAASIGNYAFDSCTNLTHVALGTKVTNIGDYAFFRCFRMTDFTIPNTVTNIGAGAFTYCLGLTNVTIPDSVSEIGYFAFIACYNLDQIFFNGNAPSSPGACIVNDAPNLTIYYLPGTTGWDDFANLTPYPITRWLPQMQTAGSSFGAQTNQFGFTINWAGGQTVLVEACTNLAHPVWQPVQTNTLTTGTAAFSDPQWTNFPARFYRLRSP